MLFDFMWIPFFLGFMFTGVMNVLTPKQSRARYEIPEKPNWVLLAIGLILLVLDFAVLTPGIKF